MWSNGLRNRSSVAKFELDVLLNYGGMGDQVCRLPALKRLVQLYGEQLNLRVFAPRYFLEIISRTIPEIKFLTTLEMFPALKQSGRGVIDFTPYTFTSMRMHLVDNAYLTLLDRLPESDADRNYLKLDLDQVDLLTALGGAQLPRAFVVMTTGFTAPVRELKARAINETVRWLKQTQGISTVFLGKSETVVGDDRGNIIRGKFSAEVDYTAGLDLRDKTSILEAAKVMSYSHAVVGLDNGLLHVAGMTDVPIVAAYTTVEPATRVPVRNGQIGWRCSVVVPDDTLECRSCQTHQNFSRHDFKFCPYGDYACLEQITSGKLIGGLKEVLGIRRW